MNRSEILAKNIKKMERVLSGYDYIAHKELLDIYNIVASYTIAELGRERVRIALACAAKLNS